MSFRYRPFLVHAGLAFGLFSSGGGAAALKYRAWEWSAQDWREAARTASGGLYDDGAARADGLGARMAADSAAVADAAGQPALALHDETRAFYDARAWAPAWTDAAARDTLAWLLADVAHDGLDPARYHAPRLAAFEPYPEDAARAEREVLLTDGFVRLAADQAGRVAPDSLYGAHWTPAQRQIRPLALLRDALAAPEPAHAVARAVHALRPPHAGYAALRRAHVRRSAALGAASAPGDSVLAVLALNMERWRWLPDSLGDLHVWVNVPEYRLWVREAVGAGHADRLTMRVVVGLPGRWRTPAMTDTLTEIVFSPSWSIPASIQRESYGHVRAGGRVQPPGPQNPLGRAKFLFPNAHAVYIHDTTSKGGFARARRALSHGCVRASAPDSLAQALLARTNGWAPERVAALWRGPWRSESVRLARTVPVHLVYFTAVASAGGEPRLLEDVYGLDAPLAAALAERAASAAPDLR